MTFDNKVALITGGGSTLGRACAVLLAELGARIVVADKDEQRAHETVRTVTEAGGEAAATIVDVTDEDQIQAMVGDAIVAYGSLNILVNNVTYRAEGDALTTESDDWRESVKVNLESPWLCARYAAPFLKSSGSGAIVHVAPSDIFRSMPRRLPYAVTKGGVPSLSRALAIDFGPQGIRSNVVVTGYIQSDHTERRLRQSVDPEEEFRRILSVHPLGRVGTPKDVAHAVAFLASDEASFITGTTVVVDGGRSAVRQDLHNWTS